MRVRRPWTIKAAARQFIGAYLREGHGHGVVLGLPWDAFKAKVDAFAAQGVKLVSMQNWEDGRQRRQPHLGAADPRSVRLQVEHCLWRRGPAGGRGAVPVERPVVLRRDLP